MNRLKQAYRRLRPRRRLWRYVSPRRRWIALAMLAALLVFAYTYARLTNDARVRRHARRYFKNLTGGRVEIAQASFSLFGGVTLRDVKIYPPGERSTEPFLRAKTVLLRHSPWSLVFHKRLDPEEVVCLEPVVTLEHDVQQDRYNFQRFFTAPGQASLGGGEIPTLPPIHVRQGRLRWVDVDRGLRVPFDEMPITLSMVPSAPGEYLITFEEQHSGGEAAIMGRLSLDVRTGQTRLVDGRIPLPNLDRALPGKYRQWRQRYDVSGEVHLIGSEPTAAGQRMRCRLVDVSLVLPENEGGLALAHLAGTVEFDETGLTLHDVTGQIPAAEGAAFTVSGRYEGYEVDSPFHLTVSSRSVSLPRASEAGGKLAELLEVLTEEYGVSGRCDLTAEVWRDAEGMGFRATAEPLGMTALSRHAPVRLTDIRGTIDITPGKVTLQGISARRRDGIIGLDGEIALPGGTTSTCLTVTAQDVLLDRELYEAMPRTVRKAWDVVDPSGRLSATVTLACDVAGALDDVDAVLDFTGQTSARPRDFSYPVDNLIGRVTIHNRDVVVEEVRGRRGEMTCLVNGHIGEVGRSAMAMDLTIEGRRLPLDAELIAAMPSQAGQAVTSLHPDGRAERVRCRLLQEPNGSFHYDVTAELEDVSFQPEAVPCQVTGARGRVEIVPGQVTVTRLTGMSGRGTVAITGRALLGGPRLELDLVARATNVWMDDKLLAALPTDLAGVSKQLTLAGPADVDLAVTSPAEPGPVDYRLEVRPKDMRIDHPRLGLSFSGVRGTVLATPDRIAVIGLAATEGPTTAQIDGVIRSGPQTLEGTIHLLANELPITAELAAILPDELEPLIGPSGGGACDVDFRRLTWTAVKPRPSENSPATTASAPAEALAQQQVSWQLEGRVYLRNAVVGLDVDERIVTGMVDGKMSSTEGHLAVDAKLSLSEVQVGRRQLGPIQGRVTKPAAASVLRIEDLAARLHGGQASGFAEIALTDPLRYGVSLSVEDVDLHELFHFPNDVTSQPGFDVAGRLRGNLQMTATAGQPDSRQATGVLKITDARIDKLPVVLGLVHVIYLWLPGGETFSDGDVTYRLQGDKLIFEEISLRGPAMSVLGSGRVNMDDETLYLTFLTGPPGYLPRIAGVEDLLRGLTREIAEVRVTGTLSNPLPRTVSLPGIDETVRRLLNPEQAQRE